MEQPATPSSLYGGRNVGAGLSPVSTSSFRTFSRNLLGSHPKSTSTTDSFSKLPAPITLAAYASDQPSLDKKLRLLEDKLLRYLSMEDTKFALMDEQCRKAIEEAQVLRDGRERVEGIQRNRINHLRDVLSDRVAELIRDRKNSAARNEVRVHADLSVLETEVGKLHTVREDTQNKQARKLGEEIAKIQQEFEKIRNLRSEQGERIADIIHEELIKTQNDINTVKEARAASENEMMKMIEETCLKIRAEMDNERRMRLFGEEQLLHLLEETCNRLEANFQIARTNDTSRDTSY